LTPGRVRLAGRILEWNDARGYGFVVPNGGGERAFVHINDFRRGSRRPLDGDLVSYLPVVDARGRCKATAIRHAGDRVPTPRQPSRLPRATLGLACLAGVVAAAALGLAPMPLAAAYLVSSGVSFCAYAIDKGAARRGGRRTAESTLHLMSLLGGWPGALVAQQKFRHKTAKQPFQVTFWAMVLLNLGVVGWLLWSGMLPRAS
jgi:uncharacterized membrane protein YsdA (DUF1294 family)/cold shock CspA family protein